jgi:hypothetical protein
MERIEVVENDGYYTLDCEAVEGVGCYECPLFKYVLSKGSKNIDEMFRKLNLSDKENESICYTLYKYIKEMEEKVRVWKKL